MSVGKLLDRSLFYTEAALDYVFSPTLWTRPRTAFADVALMAIVSKDIRDGDGVKTYQIGDRTLTIQARVGKYPDDLDTTTYTTTRDGNVDLTKTETMTLGPINGPLYEEKIALSSRPGLVRDLIVARHQSADAARERAKAARVLS
jgi:hypothetical protein